MQDTSNIFRFIEETPYDNWTLKDGALKGFYPRNSLISQISSSNNGLEVSNDRCLIKGNIKVIGRNTFRNNQRFREIYLSEGVTSIMEYAFYGCTAKEIVIPKSVRHIRRKSFSKATLLLVYRGSYGERYARRYGYKYS